MANVITRSGLTIEKLEQMTDSRGYLLSKKVAFEKFKRENLPESRNCLLNANNRGYKEYQHNFELTYHLDCPSVMSMVKEYYSDSDIKLEFLWHNRAVLVNFTWSR